MKKKCYGQYKVNCPSSCEYVKSCKYYSTTPQEIYFLLRKNKSLDMFSGFSISSPSGYIDYNLPLEKILYLFEKLNSVDEYTLYILKHIISEQISLVDLARHRCQSRQSLHRKVQRSVRRYPFLKSCFCLLFSRSVKKR